MFVFIYISSRPFKTRASTNMNNLGAALHFWYGTSSNMDCLIYLFKWFLKGVWEGYSSGHARSSSRRPWNTANKQPRLRFHVRNKPCTCRQQWSNSNVWFYCFYQKCYFSRSDSLTHWLIWLIKHPLSLVLSRVELRVTKFDKVNVLIQDESLLFQDTLDTVKN